MIFRTTTEKGFELRNKIFSEHLNHDCDEIIILSAYLGIEPVKSLGKMLSSSDARFKAKIIYKT